MTALEEERLRQLPAGAKVRHFKRSQLCAEELRAEPERYLYEIVGVASDTETGKPLMVYRAQYGDKRLFARPLEMFLSEVDHRKYPDVTQKYRFELLEEAKK